MRTRLLAIGLAAVLGLAACGTGEEGTTLPAPGTTTPTPATTPTPGPDPTPADEATAAPTEGTTTADAGPLAAAVDATLAEGSAAFEMLTSVDTPEGSGEFSASGIADFTAGERQVDLETDAGTIQTLARDDGVLVSLGEGGGWARVDPTELQGTPLAAAGLALLPLQDPTMNLELLRGVTDDVEEVGEEEVAGETTTRWQVTVDAEAAAAQADPQTQAAIEQAAGADGTLDVEVWTDDEDRIRRIQHEGDLGQGGADGGGTVQVTLDLTDFGQTPDIAEPDEGSVVDLDAQVLEQLLAQLGV